MTTPDHTVTVEFEGDTTWHGPMTCHAPAEALCHASWTCDCESWVHQGVTDGVPWHSEQDADDPLTRSTERHVGTLDPTYCQHVEWYAATDALEGTVSLAVTPRFVAGGVEFHVGLAGEAS